MKPEFLKQAGFFDTVNRPIVDADIAVAQAEQDLTTLDDGARFVAASRYVDAMELATRGILLCSGDTKHDKQTLRENFYYFAQNFVEGDINDPGNLRSHPWLMLIRGAADYDKIKNLLVDHIDFRNDIENIRAKFEQSPVVVNDDGHHEVEPSGDILNSTSTFDGKAFQPTTAAADIRNMQINKEAEDYRSENSSLGHNPMVNDEVKVGDQLYSQGEWESRHHNDLEHAPESLANPPGWGSGLHARPFEFSSSEKPAGYDFFDVKGLQINNLGDLFAASWYLKNSYTPSTYPVDRMADVYSGVVPTFPRFITPTAESYQIDSEY
jgi:hypothetical protein